MENITFKPAYWACPSCLFSHSAYDIDEVPQPFLDVPAGYCPACWKAKNPTRTQAGVAMVRSYEIESGDKVTVEVANPDSVDGMTKEAFDPATRKMVDIPLTAKEKDEALVKIDEDIATFRALATDNQ